MDKIGCTLLVCGIPQSCRSRNPVEKTSQSTGLEFLPCLVIGWNGKDVPRWTRMCVKENPRKR